MSAIFYFSITSAALVLSVTGLLLTAAMPAFDRWSKQFFQCYFIVFIPCCLTGCADLLLYGYPIPRAAVYLLLVLECLFFSLPMPMLTVYLLHCCGEPMRRSKLLRAVLGLWAVHVVLLVSAEFTGVFSYHAPDNYYYRGPLYPLMLLPLDAIQLLNLAGVVRRRGRLSRKVFLSFLVAFAPMTVAILAQMFAEVLPFVDICFIVSALSMFVYIQNEQTERYIKKERENAQLRTDIMLSQIQPHFLYNSLTVIRELCHDDPAQAEIATVKFSRYLQGNMESLKAEGAVAFEQELKHTEGYLELEKLRYEDKLTVRYDIQCTIFQIPTLTLQPIVENAVRHGVRGNPDGAGCVTVATREYPDRYEITVTDNGPGFDPETPSAEDYRTHIGIENVRERLARLCGGSLTIASAPGAGTTATILLPKEENTK